MGTGGYKSSLVAFVFSSQILASYLAYPVQTHTCSLIHTLHISVFYLLSVLIDQCSSTSTKGILADMFPLLLFVFQYSAVQSVKTRIPAPLGDSGAEGQATLAVNPFWSQAKTCGEEHCVREACCSCTTALDLCE